MSEVYPAHDAGLNRRSKCRLTMVTACLSLSLLVLAGLCQAADITVDFTATARTGPLAGDSYRGSLSYNSSTLVPTAYTFNFFTAYSLADTSYLSPISVSSTGALQRFAFLIDNDNDVASGTPDSYVTFNQGIPQFLYGYSLGGNSYPNPYGTCPDSLQACYDWQGSGTVALGKSVVTPEPGGPLPVFGYVSAVLCALWLRRRRAAC
ncbi:MAG: hypothetical protein JO138_25405 [Acidobacteriaceae bacterium]|nr:hypothetical protein [Acidobacteriaceae bacterium]